MEVQDRLLARYRQLVGEQTYNWISADLDIQVTRCFRLFQGHELKLSEYMKLKERINELENGEEIREGDEVSISFIPNNRHLSDKLTRAKMIKDLLERNDIPAAA